MSNRVKHGGRQKGTPNRVTKEVKDRLQKVLDECIISINPKDMTHNEKLKAIQICLQYLVPKPKEESNDDQMPNEIRIEIIDGDKKEKL
jgi:hypothetical protein